MDTPTDFLAKAKKQTGGNSGLAAKLNELNELKPDRTLTPQAISQWKQVPADRVIDVETVTGISRHDLRPDLSRIFVGQAA